MQVPWIDGIVPSDVLGALVVNIEQRQVRDLQISVLYRTRAEDVDGGKSTADTEVRVGSGSLSRKMWW